MRLLGFTWADRCFLGGLMQGLGQWFLVNALALSHATAAPYYELISQTFFGIDSGRRSKPGKVDESDRGHSKGNIALTGMPCCA